MEYPQAVREAVLREALSGQRTQQEIARAHGVSKSSVQQWVRRAREHGGLTVTQGEEKRSVDWSAEERFAALVETHGMSEEELGAWCRRRGVHGHELEQWRRDAMSSSPGEADSEEERRESKRLRQENAALRKELTRKDRALAETTALLVLQKKARLLWGEDEDA